MFKTVTKPNINNLQFNKFYSIIGFDGYINTHLINTL